MENEDRLFEIVFDGMLECFEKGSSFNIENILSNEQIPFEYCRRAICTLGRKLKNDVLIAIAMRKDCPCEIIESFFNSDDRFFESELFSKVFYEKSDVRLNTSLERKLLTKDYGVTILKDYFINDEDIQREFLQALITPHYVSPYLCDFAKNNIMIPDDCWELVDNGLKYADEKGLKTAGMFNLFANNNKELNETKLHFDLMRKPFDESNLDEKLCDKNMEDFLLVAKIAVNPSVSDYVITQLLVRISNSDFIEDVNTILDDCADRREKWRQEHN